MNIKNRQHLLIIVCVAAVALFLADVIVYEPLKGLWNNRSKELAELHQKVTNGGYKLDQAKAIHERWLQIQSSTLEPNQSAAFQQLNEAINKWCQVSGARLNSLTASPWRADRSGEFKTLECNVVANGNVGNIVSFLVQAERDQIGLKEQSIEVTSADFLGQKLSVHLQLSALVLTSKTTPNTPKPLASAL